ncbi:MAG: hypothetical protein CL869_00955 [Cytophagia bacterium]|nr:hypothetical protein [Cytophagia bacterium]|tara:strand:- start:1091 stop:1864 length:774 start_codon:yes stop_codon:yes gene_type:complete
MNKSNLFEKNGYSIVNVFNRNEINGIGSIIEQRLNRIIRKKIFKKNINKLHKVIKSEDIYKKIIRSPTRYIDIGNNKIKKVNSNKEIKKILNNFWSHAQTKIIWVGDPKKRELKKNKIGFRIARPAKKNDAASEHVDMYNNDMKSFVSLWIPIIGFNKKQTLRLYPSTYKIRHKLNSYIKNKKVISRVLKKSYSNKFRSTRFALKPGQGILFHPNTIHGSSDNLGKGTRVSIEFRIFNKRRFNLNKSFSLNQNLSLY